MSFVQGLPLWKKILQTDTFDNISMLKDVLSQNGINNNTALPPSLRANMFVLLHRL